MSRAWNGSPPVPENVCQVRQVRQVRQVHEGGGDRNREREQWVAGRQKRVRSSAARPRAALHRSRRAVPGGRGRRGGVRRVPAPRRVRAPQARLPGIRPRRPALALGAESGTRPAPLRGRRGGGGAARAHPRPAPEPERARPRAGSAAQPAPRRAAPRAVRRRVARSDSTRSSNRRCSRRSGSTRGPPSRSSTTRRFACCGR